MSFHYHNPRVDPRDWLRRVQIELVDLRADVAALWRDHCERFRADPRYRNALLQSLLRGLMNVLGRGPRATLLWLVALGCEVLLEALNALQNGSDRPEYA